MDRTDFSDPSLQEDAVATGPHSEVEPAWILPDCPDGKMPVGGTNDLLVALANAGSSNKKFNVTHIESTLQSLDGHPTVKVDRFVYNEDLGAGIQRSFRYPIALDAETPLGEYQLVARVYYTATRGQDPFVSLVCNETMELVPPLPTGNLQELLLQVCPLRLLTLCPRTHRTPSPSRSKCSVFACTRAPRVCVPSVCPPTPPPVLPPLPPSGGDPRRSRRAPRVPRLAPHRRLCGGRLLQGQERWKGCRQEGGGGGGECSRGGISGGERVAERHVRTRRAAAVAQEEEEGVMRKLWRRKRTAELGMARWSRGRPLAPLATGEVLERGEFIVLVC